MTTDTWIERVKAADAEAEQCWKDAQEYDPSADPYAPGRAEFGMLIALIAIAAELRAARIARRPGAGQ